MLSAPDLQEERSGSCQESLDQKRQFAPCGFPDIGEHGTGELMADITLTGQTAYPIKFPQVDRRVPMELHA